MNDDDTYTLLVTNGEGIQDSQVIGNGTQSSQETVMTMSTGKFTDN